MMDVEIKSHPKVGRPATGKSTLMISFRLPIEVLEVYRLRGERAGWGNDVAGYIRWYLQQKA